MSAARPRVGVVDDVESEGAENPRHARVEADRQHQLDELAVGEAAGERRPGLVGDVEIVGELVGQREGGAFVVGEQIAAPPSPQLLELLDR